MGEGRHIVYNGVGEHIPLFPCLATRVRRGQNRSLFIQGAFSAGPSLNLRNSMLHVHVRKGFFRPFFTVILHYNTQIVRLMEHNMCASVYQISDLIRRLRWLVGPLLPWAVELCSVSHLSCHQSLTTRRRTIIVIVVATLCEHK